ncbi:MAG TPA: hypothetical protein VHO24_20205 [Opitutaceae bacterium]|nr:hypothetical protein [Opitutaceae bacterium]
MRLLLPSATALMFAAAALTGLAAEEKSKTKEEMNALIREDAKAKAAKPTPTTAAKPAPPKANAAATAKPADTATVAATPAAEQPSPKPEATLPAVEVNKRKITELDRELYEQERNIAREKKNTKVGEIDGALNSSAVSPSILGGYSTKVRTGLAQERVELMEFEKDLTEAMARAKTKEEKAALKKQIDDIREMRRNLEKPSSGERTK